MGSGAIDLGGIGLNARQAAGTTRGGAKQPAGQAPNPMRGQERAWEGSFA